MSELELTWEACSDAPAAMFRGAAAAHGSVAYFRPFSSSDVFAYDLSKDEWSTLPRCPLYDCGLVVVDGMLTAVGGQHRFTIAGEGTNLLYSFINNSWMEHFPPMPTKRMAAGSVCARNCLIVAGGRAKFGGDILSTVEVLKVETLTWHTANSLPMPATRMMALACEEQLYLLGAVDENTDPIHSTFTCSLQTLLDSCEKDEGNVWKQVANVPLNKTSCTTLHGKAVAVGGKLMDERDSTAIYTYNPEKNAWFVTSQMPAARLLCLVATVDDDKLVVVGGWPTHQRSCRHVEVGSLASHKTPSNGE